MEVRMWNHLELLLGTASCLAAFMLAAPTAARASSHSVLVSKNPLGPDGTPRVHVGDTVTTSIRVINADTFGASVTVTSVVDLVQHGAGDLLTLNLLTAPTNLSTLGRSVTVTARSTVLEGDGDWLLDYAEVGGTDNFDGPGGTRVAQEFQAIIPGQVRILKPCLRVSVASGNAPGGTGGWGVSLTNCGNTLLTNVVVSNLVSGVFLPVFGPTSLEAQQAINWIMDELGSGDLVAWGTDALNLSVSSSALAAPVLRAVAQKPDSIAFSWNAIPGRRYQLQYLTDLALGAWNAAGDPLVAEGVVAATSDIVASNQRRFYRVLLLP